MQASSKAELILASACPSEPPLTPVSRLDALQRRLDAMTQAIDKVEAPLSAFTKVLTPEQTRELDSMGGSSSGGSSTEMGDVGNCIDQGEQFTDVPAQQIEQAVQPDASQRAKLDALKTASNQAAERLRSECPTSVPATPEKRLAAMDQRLHATITAVNEVRPALVGFYESLTDDQKARFNTLPPSRPASSPIESVPAIARLHGEFSSDGAHPQVSSIGLVQTHMAFAPKRRVEHERRNDSRMALASLSPGQARDDT